MHRSNVALARNPALYEVDGRALALGFSCLALVGGVLYFTTKTAAAATVNCFDRALTDLNWLIGAFEGAGDAAYKNRVNSLSLDFSDVVASYQAGGLTGELSLGPEIDACGKSSITSPLTKRAATINAQLRSLPKTGVVDPSNYIYAPYYTQADADQARTMLSQMINWYSLAINNATM